MLNRLTIQKATAHSDIIMAVGVIGLIGMMLIPLPPVILDMLLTLNIALSLCILLVGMYVREPLEFSVFPSLLLVATLFRLALNVSTTRLILLHASAGKVIEAFGQFVIGGDLVVGLVVFLILVIIQFVVITSGAQRVAEVAARFTLDEVPGKQLAIDADLNAGLVGEDEARRRRKNIEREADFYGAMDGASKFVRGDAIAGIIIIAINILGGLIIGIARLGLSPGEAAQRFALLTVGDGLVSQIPALLISTATGLVVTRAASEGSLGHDVIQQLLSQPRAVLIVAAMLLVIGAVPGLPKFSFLAVGAATLALGRKLLLESRAEAPEEGEGPPGALPEAPEDFSALLDVDRIALEVGYNLIPMVDVTGDGDLLDRVTGVRRQAALELGLVVPPIRIRDDMALGPHDYVIRLRDVVVARGEAIPGELLAISPGPGTDSLPGTPTVEPAFGLDAIWIKERDRPVALARGYTTVDASTVIATHLSETVKRYAPEILSRQDAREMLDSLREQQPAVVEDLVPDVATVGDVQQVLQHLLAERVSIRDLPTILEAMADGLRRSEDLERVVETVREALARRLCTAHADADGTLHVLLVSPALERVLAESLLKTEGRTVCAPPPDLVQAMVRQVGELQETASARGHDVAVLTAPLTRPHVRSVLERHFADLPVLSHAEIVPSLALESHGTIEAGVTPAIPAMAGEMASVE